MSPLGITNLDAPRNETPENRAETSFPEVPPDHVTLELLGRIKDGDGGAWDDLYRRYHDELLFAVRAHLGPRLRSALESEDVLQSVAIAAFKALPRFESRGPGSLRHFLHTMIVNKIRDRADYYGAQKRAGTVPLTESEMHRIPSRGEEPTYFDGDRFVRLEKMLRRLPPEMERILLLRKVDGLSSKEAAAVLEKTDDAVRKLYSRALARLSALMAAEEEER